MYEINNHICHLKSINFKSFRTWISGLFATKKIFIILMNLKLGETLQVLQSSKVTEIPPHSEEQIMHCREELKRLNQEIKKINEDMKAAKEEQPEMQAFRKARFALLLDQIYRIKRFLLIYSNVRCERMEDQFWFYGGDVNNSAKPNMSDSEKNYFTNYKGLIMDYIDEVGVDLTIDLDPPLSSEVEVMMLKDCGQLLTQNGQVVKLQKNSCLYLSRKLVEPFVKQGYAVIRKK